jgi:allantoicase
VKSGPLNFDPGKPMSMTPATFSKFLNLADARLGTLALSVTDDWFAGVDRLFQHTKGNYPDRVSIQAAYVKGGTDSQIETQSLFWRELLAEQKPERSALRVITGRQDRAWRVFPAAGGQSRN